MNAPIVSVLLPSLAPALGSLLTLTFANFELIILDNASVDGTQTICKKYARRDSRICYERQSEKKGMLADLKFVLNRVRGRKFFMWVATDDR